MEIIRDGHCVRIILRPDEEDAALMKMVAAEDLYAALADLRRICSDIPAIERGPRFAEINQKALAALAKADGRT